jgi:hypothetical protein
MKPQGLAFVPIGNIELNENMEFASPPSTLPYSGQRTSSVGRRSVSAAFKSRATLHLEMHPLDTKDQVKYLKDKHRIGYCNITTCCRQVCPEFITITEKRDHPARGRRVFFDPLKKLFNIL